MTVLANLSTLNLDFTEVTDAGLKELTALKSLTELGVRDTKVSDAGAKELQQALAQVPYREVTRAAPAAHRRSGSRAPYELGLRFSELAT